MSLTNSNSSQIRNFVSKYIFLNIFILFIIQIPLSHAQPQQPLPRQRPQIIHTRTNVPAMRFAGGTSPIEFLFNDGMRIFGVTHHAQPRPLAQSADTPRNTIVLIAGYVMNAHYYSFFADALSQRGHDVVIVHPPGHGTSLGFSGHHPQRLDGYHNTIEGFATMYLRAIIQAIHQQTQKPLTLMGHSRGGYIVRLAMTGLTYAGCDNDGQRPLLNVSTPLNFDDDGVAAIVSLMAPMVPPTALTASVLAMPQRLAHIVALEKQAIQAAQYAAQQAGQAAGVLAATSPLNLIWGPLAPLAAIVNGGLAAGLTRSAVESSNQRALQVIRRQLAEIVTGHRTLGPNTAHILEAIAQHSPWPLTAKQLEREIAQAQALLGPNVPTERLVYFFATASRLPPTPMMTAEIERLLNHTSGSAFWMSLARLADDGTAILWPRAIQRARGASGHMGSSTEEPTPYYIVHASGDERPEQVAQEARLFRASGSAVVEGGHGGGVLAPEAIRSAINYLSATGALSRGVDGPNAPDSPDLSSGPCLRALGN